jgi:hypothetical protein
MRQNVTIAALVLVFVSGAAHANVKMADAIDLLGNVTNASRPVDRALVVAFNLSTSVSRETHTDVAGAFSLAGLPSGIYRVVAVKSGFAPAVATVLPNRRDHRLALELRAGMRASREEQDQIWEIRRALPADILRELGIVTAAAIEPSQKARFEARMSSLTGMGATEAAGFSQAALGLRGLVGDDVSLDFEGQMRVLEQGAARASFDSPLARTSGMVMRLNTPADSYRISSTSSRWSYEFPSVADEVGEIEAHEFEWKRANTSVRVGYHMQDNVTVARGFDSERLQLTGDTRIFSSDRGDLALVIRLDEERGLDGAGPVRVAALATRGEYNVVRGFAVRYGMESRVGAFGVEWAPETGVALGLGSGYSLVVTALHKVDGDFRPADLPVTAWIGDIGGISPRTRYAAGLVSGGEDSDRRSSMSVSRSEIDAFVRLVFDDRFDHFWEAYYLVPGEVHNDARVSFTAPLGKHFVIAVMTAAGQTEPGASDAEGLPRKGYIVGSFQSSYRPSGTSLDVSYRRIEQPLSEVSLLTSESERLNFRMSQALHLPLDLRLLLGLDLARAVNSPLSVDRLMDGEFQKRVVGGISLAF